MNTVSLGTLLAVLALLLAASGLFSLAETAMMAANRHRLKHRAEVDGNPLDLTPKEFQLLEHFLLHPDEVVKRTI